MTELERRALLGDQQAQAKCTDKGIVLPCPFCGNDKNIISNWGMFRCWCPNCLAKAEDSLTKNDAMKSWNTRPAPPIGRCGECKHAYVNNFSATEGMALCKLWTNKSEGILFQMKQNDFCSYFEPKEHEENERTAVD